MTFLNINDIEDSKNFHGLKWVIEGAIPWIIDEVEDKIHTTQGNNPIHSIKIIAMQAKSWVFNQFIDLLLCQDISE